MDLSITVIIPAFNRPELLRRAVESVFAQTWGNYELIVVNDGSCEQILAEVRRLVENRGHRWMALSKNQGPAAARNRGANAGVGRWISFLDSDDCWQPEKLERQIQFHQSNADLKISQCEEDWFRSGRMVAKPRHLMQPEGQIFEECTQRCCISPSAVMLRRSLWEKLGGFDESFRVCEDFELWLRVSAIEPVGLVREPLVIKHGGHDGQLSRNVPGGIDRWRVRALEKILASGRLNHWQTVAAQNSLREKLEIVRARETREARENC